MTPRIFGTAQRIGEPTDLDAVARALADTYEPADLAELAGIVACVRSAHEPGRPAARLLTQMEAAYRKTATRRRAAGRAARFAARLARVRPRNPR